VGGGFGLARLPQQHLALMAGGKATRFLARFTRSLL
jgi:hypothetical protein